MDRRTDLHGCGIVITGAPASGKSEFLRRLLREPESTGFVFIAEVARRLLEDNPAFRNDWGAFHDEVYRLQTEAEAATGGSAFVCDRGTVDAFSFHPETAARMNTTISREYRRYFAVIQLGSAARLGRPHYSTDHIRTETPEEALIFERATTLVWKDHPRYSFVPAEVNIELKYHKFLGVFRRWSASLSCQA